MFKVFFLLALSLPTLLPSLTNQEKIEELQELSSYQDVLINGKTVISGWGPHCLTRYSNIFEIALKFQRPFTVLDLGAGEGFFSLKLALDFVTKGCTVVMLDHSPYLQAICELNPQSKRHILLNQYVSPEDLQELAKHEHFDIVLAQGFLHHQGEKWKEFVEPIFSLGTHIVIESPAVGDLVTDVYPEVTEIIQYLENLEGMQVINGTYRYRDSDYQNTLWWEQSYPSFVFKKTTWPTEKNPEGIPYLVYSDWERKFIEFEDETRVPYPNGITLHAFKKFNGTYPLPNLVKILLIGFNHSQHEPVSDEQIVIEGEKLVRLFH